MPRPPYSSGTIAPRKPMSAIFWTSSVSKCSLRSLSRARGTISLSAKSRAVSRTSRCSSVSSKSIIGPGAYTRANGRVRGVRLRGDPRGWADLLGDRQVLPRLRRRAGGLAPDALAGARGRAGARRRGPDDRGPERPPPRERAARDQRGGRAGEAAGGRALAPRPARPHRARGQREARRAREAPPEAAGLSPGPGADRGLRLPRPGTGGRAGGGGARGARHHPRSGAARPD